MQFHIQYGVIEVLGVSGPLAIMLSLPTAALHGGGLTSSSSTEELVMAATASGELFAMSPSSIGAARCLLKNNLLTHGTSDVFV